MAKKKFNTNNLVIICEGTETEYPYFEYIKNKVKDNFVDIKVILNPDDKKNLDELCERKNRKLKKLAYQTNESPKKYPLYVTLEENEDDIDANYEKYKQAPAKYAREAYLWLKNGYSEAWAVYDLDDTNDPDHSVHQCANELIESLPSSLHIAFSAYSFEEWILLNFERCATAFQHSAFKKTNEKKEENDCNGRSCHYKRRCTAECIGNYLTRKGYVESIRGTYSDQQTNKDKSYSKNDGKIYAQAIYGNEILRHRAYVNAAWSRSLNNRVFYECNPYSNVDQLIMRLLDEKKDILWIKVSDEFTLDHNKFTIEKVDGALYISHKGTETCVLNNSQLYWCDDDYIFKTSAISGMNISFTKEDNKDKQLILSERYTILCIKNGNNEFYFDNSAT